MIERSEASRGRRPRATARSCTPASTTRRARSRRGSASRGASRSTRAASALRIPHRRLGKLVVATDAAELPALEALAARGARTACPGSRSLDAARCARREPARARAWRRCSRRRRASSTPRRSCSPTRRRRRRTARCSRCAPRCAGTRARESGGWRVATRGGGGDAGSMACAAVVNAAGLAADASRRSRASTWTRAAIACTRARATTSRSRPGRRCALSQPGLPVPGAARGSAST